MSSAGRPPGGPSRPSARSPRRSSSAVYRRRRLAVGVLALVLLTGLVLGATALARAVGGGAEAAAGPTASPGSTGAGTSATGPAPTPGSAPTPGATSGPVTDLAALPPEEPVPAASYTKNFEPETCRRGSLQVTQETSSAVYGVGGIVTFTVTLRNTGAVPCLVEGGSAALGVVVTSGTDRVWASTDCPTGSTARPLLLDVGADEVVRVPWDETRSQPGCTATTGPVGPGTYRGSVTLDGGTTTDSRTDVTFLIR